MAMNRFFEIVDQYGEARNDEPYFEDGLKEIIRSHDLSLKISAKRPTDPDYRDLLNELFQTKLDESVSIVSPLLLRQWLPHEVREEHHDQ